MAGSRRSKNTGARTFQDLVNGDLKRKAYKPVYFFVGEDKFRIETVVEHIRKDILGPGGDAFNYHQFHGDGAELANVIAQALNYPMLGDKQIIWLRDADTCLLDRSSEPVLLRYLAQPVETTVLIVSAEKLDGRRKWVRTVREAGYLYDFSPPRGRGLSVWVKKAAQKAGLQLSDDLVEMLIEMVGENLHALNEEINKLALICDDKQKPLDQNQLERSIMDQGITGQYDLIENLQPRDPGPALKTWRQEAVWGARAEEKTPLLMWRIRKLALIAALYREDLSSSEVASLAGMPPWLCQRLKDTASQLGPEGLMQALRAVHQCDARMKRSPWRSDVALERAIIDICAD
jgi:DNA polymerase III delta subunit